MILTDSEILRDISPAAAIEVMSRCMHVVDEEYLTTSQAMGRIIARPLSADRDHPAADLSAMDGYAVRAAEVAAGPVPIIGTIHAGRTPPQLPPQSVFRIQTGAVLPGGADTVIRSEWCQEADDKLNVNADRLIRLGQDIRRRGEHCRAGDVLVTNGQVVGPAVIAAAAAFGHERVSVRRRLRVAIIVTGDELVGVEHTPKQCQVRESNGPTIEAQLDRMKWISVASTVRINDNLHDSATILDTHSQTSDVVLITGGTCNGDHDYVRTAMGDCGAQIMFDGLSVRPGRPTIGAISRNGTILLALPGNPVAAMVITRVLAIPLMKLIAGVKPSSESIRVALTSKIRPSLGMIRYELAGVSENGDVQVLPSRGSADIPSVAKSDGILAIDGNCANAQGLYYPW